MPLSDIHRHAVEIEVETTGEKNCGSGQLIGPRKILTALHVITGKSPKRRAVHSTLSPPTIWIRANADYDERLADLRSHLEPENAYDRARREHPARDLGWRSARLIWPKYEHLEDICVDLAVLEVEKEHATSVINDAPPAECGKAGEEQQCFGVGFPLLAAVPVRTGPYRSPWDVEGRIGRSLTRIIGTRPFVVSNGTPSEMDHWSGLSGTAMFAAESGELLGVISDANGSSQNAILQVSCLSDIPRDPLHDAFWSESGLALPRDAIHRYLQGMQAIWREALRRRTKAYLRISTAAGSSPGLADAEQDLDPVGLHLRQSYRQARVWIAKGRATPERPQFRPFPAEEVILRHRNVTLQGHPGSGKTTLLLQLALSISRKALTQSVGRRIVPVLVNARQLLEANDGPLPDRLSGIARQQLRGAQGRRFPPDLFARHTPYGCDYLVLVDGFDELTEPNRTDLVRLLSDSWVTSKSHPFRFVLAGRPTAELGKLGQDNVQHFLVEPFGPMQVEEFARRWFARVAATLSDSIRIASVESQLVQPFLRQLSASGVARMAHIPAVLSIAASIYTDKIKMRYAQEHGEDDLSIVLPRRRIDLLREFVALSLRASGSGEQRDLVRDACRKLRGAAEGDAMANRLLDSRARLLEETALAQQDQAATVLDVAVGVASSQGLVKELCDPEDQRNIIRDVLESTGLIVLGSQDSGFLHNTIREYLAAAALLRKYADTTAGLWTIVRKWGAVHWREAALMALAMASARREWRPDIERMLDRIARSSARGVAFAGMAIGEGAELPEKSNLTEYVVESLLSWNPCADLFDVSEFAKPNPLSVFHVLADNPTYRRAMWRRMRDGGSSCCEAAQEFFDFARDVNDQGELWSLVHATSTKWVQVRTLHVLVERWNEPFARQLLGELVQSTDIPLDLRTQAAATFAAHADHEETNALRHAVDNPTLKLALRVCAPPDGVGEFEVADIRSIVASLQALGKGEASDRLVRALADTLRRAGNLSTLAGLCAQDIQPGALLHFLRALVKLAPSSPATGQAVEVLLCSPSAGIDVKTEALRLAFDHDCHRISGMSEAVIEHEARPIDERIPLAEVVATATGQASLLEGLFNRDDLRVTDRMCAAVALCRTTEHLQAREYLRQGALDVSVHSELRLRFIECLLQVGDAAGASRAVKAMMNCEAHIGIGFVNALYNLGRTDLLVAVATPAHADPDVVEQACKCLWHMGDGESLIRMGRDPRASPLARARAAVSLRKIGWVDEADDLHRDISAVAHLKDHLEYVELDQQSTSSTDRALRVQRLFYDSTLRARLKIRIAGEVGCGDSDAELMRYRAALLALIAEEDISGGPLEVELQRIRLSLADLAEMSPTLTARLRNTRWWSKAQQEREEFLKFARNPIVPAIDDTRPPLGNPQGKVQIFVFEDLLCPFSQKGWREIQPLFKEYLNDVSFSVRQLPQPDHPHAAFAARVFEALLQLNPARAWTFRSRLHGQTWLFSEPDANAIKELLLEVGVDELAVCNFAVSERISTILEADASEAARLGISAVPYFVVNGLPIKGACPVETFRDALLVCTSAVR